MVGSNELLGSCGEMPENKPEFVDYWLNKQGRIVSPASFSNGNPRCNLVPLEYADIVNLPAETKLTVMSAASVAFTLGRRVTTQEIDRIVRRLRRIMPVSEMQFTVDRDPAVIRSILRGTRALPLRDVQSHIAAQLFPKGIPGEE